MRNIQDKMMLTGMIILAGVFFAVSMMSIGTQTANAAEQEPETKAEPEIYIEPLNIVDEVQDMVAEEIETEQETEAETIEDAEPEEISEQAVYISDNDAAILVRIAMAEAEGETVKGKALVMRVVLNRVSSGEFPNSIEGVVFQKNQFTPLIDGRYYSVTPDAGCYEALEWIRSGWDESQGALYFESCKGSSWHSRNLRMLFEYGCHRFYTDRR